MLREPPDILITTPGVAVPDADRARAGAVRRHALVHRRRDPRRRLDQARRAPGADARAARPRPPATRSSGSACPPPRTRSRRSAGSWSGRSAPAGSSTPACARSSTCRSTCRSSRWSSPTPRPAPDLDPLAGGTEATRRSIWPAIYPELLELIQAHRSTILFVNNRRGAERLALRLNDLAERRRSPAPTTARWPARSGRSSRRCSRPASCRAWWRPRRLELGIDMGAVDLVIQVESPKSVARGLQRIGRAGHSVGDVSRGRIFPKFRADLLECAVVAQRMREGAIETTVVPRNALDVLAQQIVAIAAAAAATTRAGQRRRPVRARHPHALLRRAQPRRSSRTCSTCSTAATRPRSSPSCARGSSGTGSRARSAPAPAPASWRSPTPARSPTAACTRSRCPTAAASASSTRRWSTRRGRARRSCSARAPGGSRRSAATA